MKRFTETVKWGDPWYRKLTPPAKLLFQWLLDNCDHAGVIEPDLELATFQIGLPMGKDTLSEIGDRIKQISNTKWLLVKFIEFQYGELSPTCKGHNPVFASLSKHGLTVIKSDDGRKNTVQQIKGMQPLSIPPKTGQGQDKDKTISNYQILDSRIGMLFGRTSPAFLYSEQSALAEISRRPDILNELAEIEAFHRKPENFFPQSMERLLTDWQKTLDRAKTHDTRKQKNDNDKRNGGQIIDRSIGTANEGVASQYKDFAARKAARVGEVVKIPDVQ